MRSSVKIDLGMEKSMTIFNQTYTLANGVDIPKLGLGTWFIDDGDAADAVVNEPGAQPQLRDVNTIDQTYTLANGVDIPKLGLGPWVSDGRGCGVAVVNEPGAQPQLRDVNTIGQSIGLVEDSHAFLHS